MIHDKNQTSPNNISHIEFQGQIFVHNTVSLIVGYKLCLSSKNVFFPVFYGIKKRLKSDGKVIAWFEGQFDFSLR